LLVSPPSETSMNGTPCSTRRQARRGAGFEPEEALAILDQLAARLGLAPAGQPGEQPPQIAR
jgi:hypothetical protein